MASANKICRVCGKEYEACHSQNKNTNTFRWQDVSCSAECGAIYLDRVNKARGINLPKKKSKYKKPELIVEQVIETNVEEDTCAVNCPADETLECIE